MNEISSIGTPGEDLIEPVVVPVEAYVSKDYARAEQNRLWRKVWLQAARLEDIPEVGDFVTYDILEDSVIIMRTGPDELSAYHNVCPHRGRRLIDTPAGQRNARGNRKSIICGFHGWTFDRQGQCTFANHADDWQGKLTAQRTALGKVSVERIRPSIGAADLGHLMRVLQMIRQKLGKTLARAVACNCQFHVMGL